jgi:hypothetical protein
VPEELVVVLQLEVVVETPEMLGDVAAGSLHGKTWKPPMSPN